MLKGNKAPQGSDKITISSTNKRSVETGLKHRCPYCGITNGSKMSKFVISGNRSFYVHNNCCREIADSNDGCVGTASVIEYLEKNTNYNFNKKNLQTDTCQPQKDFVTPARETKKTGREPTKAFSLWGKK